MAKIILYSAASLDQFIANEDGGIDWLFSDQDYGYYEFIATIGTTLMGYKTYEKLLSFGGDWPYPKTANYVFTRKKDLESNDQVSFINSDIEEFSADLKEQSAGDIWLIGGGQINTLLIKAGLVDELVLSIHPIFLGRGIPLFAQPMPRLELKLIKSQTFPSGLVQLHLGVS